MVAKERRERKEEEDRQRRERKRLEGRVEQLERRERERGERLRGLEDRVRRGERVRGLLMSESQGGVGGVGAIKGNGGSEVGRLSVEKGVRGREEDGGAAPAPVVN